MLRKKWWDCLKRSLLNPGFTSSVLDPCAFVLIEKNKVRGVTGVHVDDLLGAGGEVFDRVILEVKRGFDLGAWDVGTMRFKIETVDTDGKQRSHGRHETQQT